MNNKVIKSVKAVEPTIYDFSTIYKNRTSFEVVTSKNQSTNKNFQHLKKIDKNHYVNIITGEVKEYNTTPYKTKTSLNKTLARVKRLVNANVSKDELCLHLILTYSECVSNPFRITNDFKSFWNEIKKHYPNYSYIWIAEPHATKSWHIHAIIKTNDGSIPYIEKEKLKTLWSWGNSQIKYCPKTNNFGCYFCKNEKLDRYEKYPSKMRIYSHSKDIIIPKPIRISRGELLKFAEDNNMERTHIKTINICSDTMYGKRILNQITYENFETKEGK